MSKHCHSAAAVYRCPYTTDMFNQEGNQAMNIEELIEAAEQAHTHAAEAKRVALDACAHASVYLGKAEEAETKTKQLLNLLREQQEQGVKQGKENL